MLGLCFCARAFSSCGERGPLFIAVRGPLTVAASLVAASLVAEHRLQTHRLSSCGSRAQLLRGMWDLPRPGLEPVSPALAGRFSTTAPPGKPPVFLEIMNDELIWMKTGMNGGHFLGGAWRCGFSAPCWDVPGGSVYWAGTRELASLLCGRPKACFYWPAWSIL